VKSNKEFSKNLEERPRRFGVKIVFLSSGLPIHQRQKLYGIKLPNRERLLERTTGKLIAPEERQILGAELRFVKVKRVKRNTG
jgi:hypothetical protein